ncbi:MAG: hypothetical protein AAGN82_11870 [Myxococcota bacterium]
MVSPHFGPWSFGPDQNSFQTLDFEVGEVVHVELDGPKDAYVVRSVIAVRQRQPDGTGCPELDELNRARPGDMLLEEAKGSSLTFWLGDCCEWCNDAWLLTFHNARSDDLDEDTDLDDPLLRLASEEETRALSVPDDSTAYCIVTNHGNGRDERRFFIVASRVEIQRRPRAAGTHP